MESELSTQTTLRPAQILAFRLGVSYHPPDSPSLPGTLAFETIRGAAGVDFIGTDGADILLSLNEAGAKVVDAKGGNDSITLDDATAVVGTATVKGGAGDDTILIGTAVVANNQITRLSGSSVNGGEGNDTITTRGVVNSTIRGNQGEDVFNLRGNYTSAVINGNSGGDVFNLDAAVQLEDTKIVGGNSNDGQMILDSFDITAVNSTLNGNKGNDAIIIGGTAAGTNLTATGFTVFGGQGDDTIQNEFATVTSGNVVTYSGDKGDDDIDAGVGNGSILGGEGNDTLNGEAGKDTIEGGVGDDVIDGGAGDDVIKAEAGDDTIALNTGGEDTVTGGAGKDTYTGADVVDFVFEAIADSPATFSGAGATLESAFDDFTGFTFVAGVDDLVVDGVDNILAGSVATTVNNNGAINIGAAGGTIHDAADIKAAIEAAPLTASALGTIQAYVVTVDATALQDDGATASTLAGDIFVYLNDTNTIFSSGDMMVEMGSVAQANDFITEVGAAV